MMSLPASRLFEYANRHELDATGANAFASDGSVRVPRIPAELLYGPFRVFLDEVQEPLYAASDARMTIPQNPPNPFDFFPSVHSLFKCVARRYENEDLYTRELAKVMTSLVGITISRALTPRNNAGEREGQTDGTIVYAPLGSARRQFILLRQDKLGSGSGGGDSFVELLGHYINIVRFDPPSPPNPCVFLEVVGPRLIVSLAACTAENDVCISPAVVSINLMVTAGPDVLYGRVAALFAALRRLVATIANECHAFPPPLLASGARRGPNLVFATDTGFSKFLRSAARYGAEVHQWCATQTPQLAPTMEESAVCAGWREIKMETPGAADEWRMATEVSTEHRAIVLQVVRDIVGRMHHAGFVHGDVRAANVLVRIIDGATASGGPAGETMVSAMLIDFDEAGRMNEAHYGLLPFNPSVPCAPGVVPGGLIETSHDLWRVESEDRFYA